MPFNVVLIGDFINIILFDLCKLQLFFIFFFLFIETIQHKLILTFDVVQLILFFFIYVYGILENLLFNRYWWNCSNRLNLTSKCRVWFIKVQIQLTTQKLANNWWEWTNKCQWYIHKLESRELHTINRYIICHAI